MTDPMAIALASVVYTLVGVRAFSITRSAFAASGEPSTAGPALVGMVWPFFAVSLGLCLLLLGDAGRFRHLEINRR